MNSRNPLHDFLEVIATLESGSFPVNDVVASIVGLSEIGNVLSVWDFMPSHVPKILVNLDPVGSI